MKTQTNVLKVLTLAITWVGIELVLRALWAPLNLARYNNLARWFSKNVTYHFRVSNHFAPGETGPHFDRLLGWRNNPQTFPKTGEHKINGQGWRSASDFVIAKTKKRIVLAGDSFTNGFTLEDPFILSNQLQKRLGSNYEVMNFAVGAYGFDQMALVATEIAPDYHPDVVVIAFIGDDVYRSCRGFFYDAEKPYFELQGTELKLLNVPVPNPSEAYAFHSLPKEKFVDTLVAQLFRSRIAALVGQLVLEPAWRNCAGPLMQRIAAHVIESAKKNNYRLIFFHLEGPISKPFDDYLKQAKVDYLSFPRLQTQLESEFKTKADSLPDGHPGPSRNILYAGAIAKALSQPRLR